MELEKAIKRFIPMSETMFYILFSLQEERHGYGIKQFVQELTHNRIDLGAGTIYQSISKLEHDELISSTKEIDRKKLYLITPLGKEILRLEGLRICEIYSVAKELL